MEWYYVEEGERRGPVDEIEFQSLVDTGVIRAETQVWNDTFTDWQPYANVVRQFTGAAAPVSQADLPMGYCSCAECGNAFPSDDMVKFQESFVCAVCKPIFFQRLREGVRLPTTLEYAGFWIRAGAKIIDSLLVGVVGIVIQSIFIYPGGALIGGGSGEGVNPNTGSLVLGGMLVTLGYLIPICLGAWYTTWFLGKYAATPGKMACGLRVVRSDGTRLTYWRAFGRYFGDMLSGLTCYIGYIIAAFDDEKRALHDHICDTRVVRK
jgi:uncharacterized RDD family membrane protein YckC